MSAQVSQEVPGPMKVLVYSNDRKVRQDVLLALGRRPAADLPELTYVECATAPALVG